MHLTDSGVRARLGWRNVQAWTALGRLYAEAGAGAGVGLAASCYMQARSHNPMYAAPWEAMAALAGTQAAGAALLPPSLALCAWHCFLTTSTSLPALHHPLVVAPGFSSTRCSQLVRNVRTLSSDPCTDAPA